MNEPEQPECVYCDWKEYRVYLKSEIGRISIAMESVDRKVEHLIQVERENTTRQIEALSEACKANAIACEANREELSKLKIILARNVAVYSSIAGAAVAFITELIKTLRG